MSYNRENYIRLREQFQARHLEKVNAAMQRKSELHRLIPELKVVDTALAETGAMVYREIVSGSKSDLDARLARVRGDNEALQETRAMILAENGYAADETDPHFECMVCQDRGTVGVKMCSCFKKALVLAGYESSGIGHLIHSQSFESFDLSLYPPENAEHMKMVLDICRRYADSFSSDSMSNLLFRGNTGLGKTHLTTSIAKVVIERGYDVLYDTAQNIFSDFEADRFRTGTQLHSGSLARYFDCELLIIDDLGTELSNAFTVSCLYNIINTRINTERSTIINTNLAWNELRSRYADRITSRLFGEFAPLEFIGRDIRGEKLTH